MSPDLWQPIRGQYLLLYKSQRWPVIVMGLNNSLYGIPYMASNIVQGLLVVLEHVEPQRANRSQELHSTL